MFSFFVLLIGLVYISIRLIDEKIAKTQGEARQSVYDSIESKISRPLGEYNPPKTREEFCIMCESISDDLRHIFGDDWRYIFNYAFIHNYASICRDIDPRNTFTHEINIAYNIWLSKKGYYDSSYFRRGYNYAGFNGVNNPENQELILRVCQTIEKNIQAAHPELSLKLYTVPDNPYFLRWGHHFDSFDGTKGKRLW